VGVDSLLLVGPFGCLERIDLYDFLTFTFHVTGEIARPISPLGLWIGERLAVDAVGGGYGLAATLAGFHRGVANTAIEVAALFGHEKALGTLFDRLTTHGSSLLYCADPRDCSASIYPEKNRGGWPGSVPR
jgi:hypothetical protein